MTYNISSDRSAALLTQTQREALRGEKEINDARERMMRMRIRKRLESVVFDMATVTSGAVPIEDIDKALSEPDDWEASPGSRPPIANRMHSFAALIYLYHREQEERGDAPDGWATAQTVQRGIQHALTVMGVAGDVSVDIEVERRGDISQIADRVDDLADLSIDTLSQLLKTGEISSDEHAAAWRRKQERGDFDDNDE